jgi:hypothetical protein
VLFLLFGSAGAGKTTALEGLGRRELPSLAIHDFDEIGVPPGADTAWRQRANEQWVRRALEYQADGLDLLLAGSTPLGELLATPSAPLLVAISACLLDCDDATRLARLGPRGQGWVRRGGGQLRDYVNWAEWMRRHAADPNWRPAVIRRSKTGVEMRWERLSDWTEGDPRWRVRVVDTTERSVDDVADELADWIADERALVRSGEHPLLRWAD